MHLQHLYRIVYVLVNCIDLGCLPSSRTSLSIFVIKRQWSYSMNLYLKEALLIDLLLKLFQFVILFAIFNLIESNRTYSSFQK